MLEFFPKSLIRKDVEVIIVDNNSNPVIKEELQQIVTHYQAWNEKINLISISDTGLTAARHAGVKAAQGEIITFFDDDIVIADEWFDAIDKAFKNPDVSIVGGPSLPYLLDGPPDWFWKTFSSIKNGWSNHFYSLIDFDEDIPFVDPDYIFGLNLSIRKKHLILLNGFNPDILPKEKLFYQGDGETGLTKKIALHKLRADFIKGAKVYHQLDRSRLNRNYLNKRSYFQGIVDSYSDLRGANRISYRKYFNMKFNNFLCKVLNRKGTLFHYSQGYLEHLHEYRSSLALRQWVCKEHYFD